MLIAVIACTLFTIVIWLAWMRQINRNRLQAIEGTLAQHTQRSLQEFFVFLPVKWLIRGYLIASIILPLIMGSLWGVNSAGITLLTCLVSPPLIYRRFRNKRYRALQRQLPMLLMNLSNQLKSGMSMVNAITSLFGEFEAPLGQEINEIIRQIKLGDDLPTALIGWQQRVPIFSITLVVQALILGYRNGGQQSQVLRRLAENLGQQQKVRDRQQALSAQGRMQAWVLICMPFALFLLLNWMKPTHTAYLTNTLVGQVALGAALILTLIGAMMVKRILNTDDF
ncbi:tight adherence protein B [Idiomarina fontislapidosi]|uniref:Type II secretion system protein GspF domain-containing protein n=1 Tax=Idiomarina fontislapidosi TaxID=263723 RepID=A0A432YBA9_9GAMM|nr:type II secretion system F family protein [Idiomarina fontislapidosi]PYE35393.1 tight adherence protein B [Idiomarina fontislapidosi]RUO58278.1 hypothetical protein CWE25_01415 [Idiomarina fontislapidosi]